MEGATVLKWNFSWHKQKSQKEGMVGIYETPVGIALAYGVLKDKKPIIIAYTFKAADTADAKQAVINAFVNEHALADVDCTYVLGIGEYSLNLVESPSVAATEVPMAMRWVLKDLINFPVEEAVIETFDLPFLRARDNIKMTYAVAVQKGKIDTIVTRIKTSGLNLRYIDIPELTLKNIMIENPQKIKGCAFVQLDAKGGRLILCRDDQICITRSFDLKLADLGKDPAQDAKTLESLALEFQRSFDYLNSVFRQSIQNTIVLAPTIIDKTVCEASLKTNLGSEFVDLKLDQIFKFDKPIEPSTEVDCLFAFGAVLRIEEVPV
jgi:MSHA biogenesis protein MshI